MTAYAAFLRAVNVGGTGQLAMRDLVTMCEHLSFRSVRTYIASGNVVFESDSDEAVVRAKLEELLLAYAGKPVAVMVRTADELSGIVAQNPFPNSPPNKVAALLLNNPPEAEMIEATSGQKNEVLETGPREIYIYYPDGMGRSKLKIPAAAHGTTRSMNTVAKLAAMAAEI